MFQHRQSDVILFTKSIAKCGNPIQFTFKEIARIQSPGSKIKSFYLMKKKLLVNNKQKSYFIKCKKVIVVSINDNQTFVL